MARTLSDRQFSTNFLLEPIKDIPTVSNDGLKTVQMLTILEWVRLFGHVGI